MMDMPTHLFVFPDTGNFQMALEFMHKHKLDCHEGTVYGSRSLEVYASLSYSLLLKFSKDNGLSLKLYVSLTV